MALNPVEDNIKSFKFTDKEFEVLDILRKFVQSLYTGYNSFAFYESSGRFYFMPKIMTSDKNYLFQLSVAVERISGEINALSSSPGAVISENISAQYRNLIDKDNTDWSSISSLKWEELTKSITRLLGSNSGDVFGHPEHLSGIDASVIPFLKELKTLVVFSYNNSRDWPDDITNIFKGWNPKIMNSVQISTFRRSLFFDRLQSSLRFIIDLSSIIGRLIWMLESKAPQGHIEVVQSPSADNYSLGHNFWKEISFFLTPRPEIIRGASLFEPVRPSQLSVQAPVKPKIVAQAAPIIKKLSETRFSEKKSDSSRKIEEFMKELVELARMFNASDAKSFAVLGELLKRYELVENLKVLFAKNESDRFRVFKEITFEFTAEDLRNILEITDIIVAFASDPNAGSVDEIINNILNAYDVPHSDLMKESIKHFVPFALVDTSKSRGYSIYGDQFLPFLVNNIAHSSAKDKDAKLDFLLKKYPHLRGMIMKAP